MRNFAPGLYPARYSIAAAAAGIAMVVLMLLFASPARPAPPPAPTAAASPAASPDQRQETVLTFLAEAIDWYRHTAIEQQLITEPAETLYVSDNRQISNEVMSLVLQYARAEAALVAATSNQPAPAGAPAGQHPAATSANSPEAGSVPDIGAVTARLGQVQAEQAATQARIARLKDRIANAGARQREALNAELVSAEEEAQLGQARIDGIKQILDFENSTQKTRVSNGLLAQIDELEQSLPRNRQAGAPIAEPAAAQPPAITSGILQLSEQLLELRNKDQALLSIQTRTATLNLKVAALRAPLIGELRSSDRRGLQMSAKAGLGDLPTVEKRQQTFAQLLQARKLTVDALLPLAKVSVDLNLYRNNLDHWRQELDRRWNEALRTLLLRLIVLGGLIGLIAIGAVAWRQLAFRYIQDVRHRQRVLQVRTLTVIALLVLVLLFNFSSEIGALATVMGLATAGIAFALQNVILSVAGYFFLSGRYGVRVGDRIQVAGVYGTVIDVGLVKLTLMELSGEGNFRQPTGRVVVFANSIVFQTNGNFFKQAPGISFVWSELRLTLAPDCDYQLAEKLLVDAVNDVVGRYREDLRREYRENSQLHNVWFEPPEPRSSILLGADGIRMAIRYPVEARRAVEINDELSRRVLNVISHEPRLRLVSSGTPTIQGVPMNGDGTAAAAPAPPFPAATPPSDATAVKP